MARSAGEASIFSWPINKCEESVELCWAPGEIRYCVSVHSSTHAREISPKEQKSQVSGVLVLFLGSAATLEPCHILTNISVVVVVVVIHTSSAAVTRLLIVPVMLVVMSVVVVEASAVAAAVEALVPASGLEVVPAAIDLLVVLGELDLDRVVLVEGRGAVHLRDSGLCVFALREFEVSKAPTVPSLVVLDHIYGHD